MNIGKFFPLTVAFVTLSLAAEAAGNEEERLLRFPSVGGDKIAFTYAGDLYTVPLEGGIASRLTSDIGFEMFSRFSPDGNTIAFTAQYDGNTEVYTIPAEGGAPHRITYSALVERDNVGDRMGPDNIVMCWTPDGRNIVYRSKWYTFSGLRGTLWQVPAEGGDPVQIPTTEGGFCSYSSDGRYLAMNRMFREFRTWKYYRGGQADDIWINRVGTTELKNVTSNDAQDIFPMWIGNEIYFLSDRDSIMNLFCYDVKKETTRKVTDFTEYDCKFPSFSKDYVVFENGGYIYKFSVAQQKCEKVPVIIRDEALHARNTVSGRVDDSFDLSPDGKRVVMAVHGDIFSLPAEKGATYNVTNTPGAQEREVCWSPDGRQIAYFSDVTGEYQVFVADASDFSRKKQLTNLTEGYPESLRWSPDSKSLFFTMEDRTLRRIDVEAGKCDVLNTGEFSEIYQYDVSPDSRYVAYAAKMHNSVYGVYICDTENGEVHQVTSSWFESAQPVFSGDGKYLFLISYRDLRSRYSQVEWNASYELRRSAWVLPLANSTPNPLRMRGDEYFAPAAESDTGTVAAAAANKKDSKKETPAVRIDFKGMAERMVKLPIPVGSITLVGSFDDALYYYESNKLKKISMADPEPKEVGKAKVLAATSDGKKALVSDNGKYYVASSPSYSPGDTPVPVEDAVAVVDYAQEWRQIFEETWRIYRDGFYVKNMVGKDWKGIHDKYAVLLPYVHHRQDLTYIIGEMISELATGHCYVTTGEVEKPKRVSMGLLGARFSRDRATGAYRIDHIFESVAWSPSLYSPLGEPGLGVKEGDYIISINRMPVADVSSIYELLVGKVGRTVALEVASNAKGKDARTVYVKPVEDESALAYYEWVQRNIRIVEEASDGEIGYIHIPDMSSDGLDMFTRLFYTQLDKKALIIDDRMNGGGNVSPMILERLQREVYRLNMRRDGGTLTETIPESTHYGPKVCLIDKYSSSDGDLFPYGFKKLGIGKLIGMRTWGGIVGISSSKPYLDRQDVRTPFFTSYSTDGDWIIENHGVDPDIVTDINPFEDFKGKDAQLVKAVEVLKEELKSWPTLPEVPADPVR